MSNSLLVLFYALVLVLGPSTAAAAEEVEPSAEKKREILLHLGNESNPVDGIFGPYTYGLKAAYDFAGGIGTEATYVRLHEPGTPGFESQLDEAQFLVRAPLSKSIGLGATAWKNRMIDMYTSLLGLELEVDGPVAVTISAYSGLATREDAKGRFRGGQLSGTTTVGRFEFAASCLLGKIESGFYRKVGLEASTDLGPPATLVLSVEDRYFSFGAQGPVSEPRDEFIFVGALELHLEKLIGL